MQAVEPGVERPARSGTQRQAAILELLERNGRVEVGEVAELLDVTDETIRRDLRLLEQRGRLTRAHGGAIRSSPLLEGLVRILTAEVPIHPLAEAALTHVPAEGSVFIDAGPAAESLASLLPDSPSLQVITSSVPVALIASRKADLLVYNLGGTVEARDGSESGQWTREELQHVRVDVAFVSARGISTDGWLTAPTPKAAAVMRGVLDAADRTVLLVDDQGFDTKGLVKYAHLSDIDVMVFHPSTPEAFVRVAAESGAQVASAGTGFETHVDDHPTSGEATSRDSQENTQ
ncbi:MAG: D-beta-D-heptose 1-phosphate adenosyltransferase [Cryobacterium sp.]|jgi:DeoR/GlpR family transcriptional regulator of sugar metabolism|nr:D-beta-D-heptose 1-phosphate adenosyltransferase [Cryobacterium sp.]